jgi:PadR family transcriptional regulator PadR
MDAIVSTRFAILQALLEGDAFGLEIVDRVRRQTNGGIQMRQGGLYPALRAMTDEGLLTSYEGPPIPERAGRPRRFYRLTASGQREAKESRKVVQKLLRLVPQHSG